MSERRQNDPRTVLDWYDFLCRVLTSRVCMLSWLMAAPRQPCRRPRRLATNMAFKARQLGC